MTHSQPEVTVQAQANVLGLAVGQTVTVEHTDTVQTHVDAGLLAVVEPDTTPEPATPAKAESKPPAKENPSP